LNRIPAIGTPRHPSDFASIDVRDTSMSSIAARLPHARAHRH
jgi:hypothetical protein